MIARQMALDALKGSHKEMISVLDAINAERMPHDGDEFHERLAANIKAIAALDSEIAHPVEPVAICKMFSNWYDSLPYGEPSYQETFGAGYKHSAPQEPAVNAELLEALQGIMAGVAGVQQEPHYKAARAAIAKAGGDMSAAHTPLPSLADAFIQGMHEADENWQALPQRLRGRGRWLQERGRIKDCELMFDAATEIESLRADFKRRSDSEAASMMDVMRGYP